MAKQRGNPVPEWKLRYIRVNHTEQTASQMAKALEISGSKIYSYCKSIGIMPKANDWYKCNRLPGTTKKGHPFVPKYKKEEIKKDRPKGEYSNANYHYADY